MLLGAIADDFTAASELGNTLSRVPKSGLPVLGQNSAKTKNSKQAFVGQPRNVCLAKSGIATTQCIGVHEMHGAPEVSAKALNRMVSR